MADSITGYKVYKGLQKPLVFKRFKGKYIYWAAAVAFGSFILIVILSTSISITAGIIGLVVSSLLGMFIVLAKQRGGLHNKEVIRGTYVVNKLIRRI